MGRTKTWRRGSKLIPRRRVSVIIYFDLFDFFFFWVGGVGAGVEIKAGQSAEAFRGGVQATHIFDGLEEWPTHLAYVAGGRLLQFEPSSAFPEMREGRLLSLVERCVPVPCPSAYPLPVDVPFSLAHNYTLSGNAGFLSSI